MRINVWTGDDEENHRRNRKKNIYMAITCCCYIKYWSATKRLYDMPEIDVKDNINTYASSSYSQRRSSCRFCSKKREKNMKREKNWIFSVFCLFFSTRIRKWMQTKACNERPQLVSDGSFVEFFVCQLARNFDSRLRFTQCQHFDDDDENVRICLVPHQMRCQTI